MKPRTVQLTIEIGDCEISLKDVKAYARESVAHLGTIRTVRADVQQPSKAKKAARR